MFSGTPVSPWRYGQSERSPIVQLAEALSDGGLDVDAVVSTNRVVPSRYDFGEGHWIDSSLGEALRLELEWGTAVVSLKPTLGWVMDVDSGLAVRRMDLSRSLTGKPSSAPGLAADQIETVATAVRQVVEAGPPEPTDGRPPVEVLLHERPDILATAWWMRELGYARTEAYGDTIASTAHVEVWSRQTPVAIGDVQRTFARAALEGKKPLLIATSQFTRSARKWADDADIALFTLWGEDLMLHQASKHAEEHLPRVF
jgi:hypothetical protein